MNRPRMLVCYICGREYGSRSLKIHQKQCKALYLKKQSQLPENERKPLPKPIKQYDSKKKMGRKEIDRFNQQAFEQFDKEVLVSCEYCGRTFKPESLKIHHRSCTAEHPAKRIVGSPSRSTSLKPIKITSEKEKTPQHRPKKIKKNNKSPHTPSSSRVRSNPNPLSMSQPVKKRKKKATIGHKKGKKSRTKMNDPFNSSDSSVSPFQTSNKIEGNGSNHNNSVGGGGIGGGIGNGGLSNSYTFGMSPAVRKPLMLFCYLCGREFSISSLPIHLPSCKKKRKQQLELLPYKQLREKKLPKGPSTILPTSRKQKKRIERYNEEAYHIYLEKSRLKCPGCGRKFEYLSFEHHLKGCTSGKAKMEEKEGNNGMPGPRPNMLVCYICGREYGTMSLPIHQEQCKKRFLLDQLKLPPHLRKPLPQPPVHYHHHHHHEHEQQIDYSKMTSKEKQEFNEKAFEKYDKESLVECEHCGRTFRVESLPIHQKSCTAEHPAKRINRNLSKSFNASSSSPSLKKKKKKEKKKKTKKTPKKREIVPKLQLKENDEDDNFEDGGGEGNYSSPGLSSRVFHISD